MGSGLEYARQLLEHALEVSGAPAAAGPEDQGSDYGPLLGSV
jgi:hypothetical protein